jgi:cytochrome c oxidase assembly protein subunit 15
MVAILRNKRRDLRTLGLVQILGILAQGVLGGITVLTGLNPATVSAHFLLSIVLIAAALSLRQRAHGVTPTNIKLAPLTRRLARATVTLTALVIFAGTIVTGSGPHAGDDLAERFNLDPRMMSWIHALLIAIRLGEAEDTRSSWGVSARNFLIICLAQGLIGYTQYFTGLPELLVGFHILGSVLVWLTVWNITIKGNVLSRS